MTNDRTYRLALSLPRTRDVLAMNGDDGSATLPVVSARNDTRAIEQLNRIAFERWHLETVVLDVIADAAVDSPCVVMEVRNEWSLTFQNDLRPVRADALTALSTEERVRLQTCLSDDSSWHNPFSKVGWVEDVRNWIRQSLPDRAIRFIGDIVQLNAGGGFELCRLSVHDGPAYWLKAVGPPNLHEFSIMQQLAKLLPRYLPPVVAMREELKAWVTEETGHPLEDAFTLSNVKLAVAGLAELQRESIPYVGALQDAGCADGSLAAIEAHLPEIRAYLEEAMAQQTSTKVAALDTGRLRELEVILREACFRMQDLGIPDTLIHNDINAGNILVSEARCFFIDWAEGQIGNPFMTFQHVCAQIARDVPNADLWIPEVRRSYRDVWRGLLRDSQVGQACALMPILAVASYLYGRGTWLSSPERNLPHFQLYARSLARYIDRAARSEELEEVLCQ